MFVFFFFQAEDGIRDVAVTGVQTCALPILTVDDMIDAMVKEQTEDLHKLGGVEALDEPYTKIGFGTMIRKRAGWLCALFLSESLTATAMQYFEGELSRAIV